MEHTRDVVSASGPSEVDVHLEQEPAPTVAYRSQLTVYEESLINGQLVARAWNGAGFINPWEDARLDPARHPTPFTFWVEVDGQLLHSHWEWVDFQQSESAGTLHAVLELRHAVRPVTVRVHTVLDGTAILTRWLEITNQSDAPAGLGAAYSWCGVLQFSGRRDVYEAARAGRLFSLGYMESTHWGREGDFQWHALPTAAYTIAGRQYRGPHRHPVFVLGNLVTGEHFICQLAWSGGYTFTFDLDAEQDEPYNGNTGATTSLFFRAGPEGAAPLRMLAPGETVVTPEVHLGLVLGDLDASVQAMHDHLRRSVFLPEVTARAAPVEAAIGPELEITEERVFEFMEVGARLGAEVFFIDASWYAPPRSDWWNTVGDWEVGSRFPKGLAPFRERAHALGMGFGLWMEPERFASASRNMAAHPDFVAQRYTGQPSRGHLDLTRPEVAQWMENEIGRVIAAHQLDFFRLDYNVGTLGLGFQNQRDGFLENHYWRYYEALYGIYTRLRQRFPNAIFENCASGGARTDIGMVRRFDHTWVTDWQVAPRSFWITNGMTIALPPEHIDRLFDGQNSHIRAHIDFQARFLLFGRPTVGLVFGNALQLERLQHVIRIYKEVVRPFHRQSRIYHHTPTEVGNEHPGWGVLELAARDHTRSVAALFRLDGLGASEYLFRPRGLDVARTYAVTFDNSGQTALVDGYTLITQGIVIRLESALTSELLLFDAV
jgi:alpha-galactosidase